MSFTVPDAAVAAYGAQADLDSIDLGILASGFGLNGVLAGAGVTAQGSPDMTVAVAAGTLAIAGVSTASGAAPALAIGAADPALPRFDLVVASGAGAVVVAGVAAADAVFPAVPGGSVALAAVYVPAAAASIAAGQITDKRLVLSTVPEGFVAGLVADLAAKAPDAGVVHLAGGETLTGAKIMTAGAAASPLTIQAAGLNAAVSTKALTANVATIGTAAPHNFVTGHYVLVAGVGAPFNGTFLISSIVDATHFTYACVGVDVAVVASGGTATADVQTGAALAVKDGAGRSVLLVGPGAYGSTIVQPSVQMYSLPLEADIDTFGNVPLKLNSNSTGIVYVGAASSAGLTVAGGNLQSSKGQTAYGNGTGGIPIRVFGAAGQTADLQTWSDSTPAILAKMDKAGALTLGFTPASSSAASVPLTVQGSSAVATVSNKALTTNVATLTTAAPHNFVTGHPVLVAGVGAPFNGTFLIASVPDGTHFTYAVTNADIASVASGGTATADTQTGNLWTAKDGTGQTVCALSNAGSINFGYVQFFGAPQQAVPYGEVNTVANAALRLNTWSNGQVIVGAGSTASFSVVGGLATLNKGLYVLTGAIGTVGVRVRATAGQTANLFEVEDSTGAGATGMAFDAAGRLKSFAAAEAATASAGVGADVPATVQGYLIFTDSGGTARKIPYYAT